MKPEIYRIAQKIKENWKSVVITIIIVCGSIILTVVSIFYGLVAVISKDTMLTSLIEAEATIIGFYGLILVYALTSFDSRADRIEQQLFDLIEKEKYSEIPIETLKTVTSKNRGKSLDKALKNIQQRKIKLINSSLLVGVYLVSSLLLSILALGMPDISLSLLFCMFAVALFFSGIIGIFGILYNLSARALNASETKKK
jgi:uncharacterized membrane protein